MTALTAPRGCFATEDAAAAKRRQIAELLKKGEDVHVTSSGQVVPTKGEREKGRETLKAPEGKLARR